MGGNKAYAIPAGSVSSPERMRQFAGFIFWTAWSASTNRPDDTVTYTQNWPFEPLIGNRPTGDSVLWTGVSIIMLLAGICAMVWWYASETKEEQQLSVPAVDPLASWQATPSQRATLKYFWIVSALILVQILMASSLPTTAWRETDSTDSKSRRFFPTASRAPGTSRSASSGSPPPG